MSNACNKIKASDAACSRARCYNRTRSAFTLIELLVVIAITAVLLTLLFQPLLYGFQFTSEAQATTEAQDAARVTMEQVTREIGSAAAVRDTSGKYLDMRVFTPTGNDEVIAHAYNAYIDIVPARTGTQMGTSAPATVADPTVNPYVETTMGEGYYVDPAGAAKGQPSLVSSPITLPLSPGTTIVRYFIGLTTPFPLTYTGTQTDAADEQEEPYINRPESQVPSATASISGNNNWAQSYAITNNLNNPYILYRAEVSPYKYQAGTGGAQGTYVVNTELFDEVKVNNVETPILDDPDFFRMTGVAAHDARVYHWFQAAKPVIDSSDANLLIQAHTNRGIVQYGNVTTNVGQVQLAAGTTVENGTSYPIVRTSVSFSPATVSDQPMNPTSTSDVSQGFGSAPADALVPYIPTQYASQTGQWSGNKNLLITDNSLLTGGTATTPNTYTTYVYQTPAGTAATTGYNEGDLIETNTAAKADVFDVSTGEVIDPGNSDSYVVFSVGSGGGSVNFSTPNIPVTESQTGTLSAVGSTTIAGAACGDADPNNTANPFWYVTFGSGYTGAVTINGTTTSSSYGTTDADNVLQIHLKPQPQLAGYDETKDAVLLPNAGLSTSNYLPNIATASFGPTGTVAAGATPASSNGRVVANSERVYGPEENPGAPDSTAPTTAVPANYPVVLYRRVAFNIGQVDSIGADQYMIDYDHGIIYLGEPKRRGAAQSTYRMPIRTSPPARCLSRLIIRTTPMSR